MDKLEKAAWEALYREQSKQIRELFNAEKTQFADASTLLSIARKVVALGEELNEVAAKCGYKQI